jgi:PhnB protein
LGLQDNTRQAMEFYQSIFGGKLDVSTFKEFNSSQDPSEDNLVMHSMLTTDSNMVLMGSDTPSRVEYKPGSNFSVSLSGDNETEPRGYFEKLSAGGTITMPLEKAVWGDSFGMLVDKFGVNWMVNIAVPAS